MKRDSCGRSITASKGVGRARLPTVAPRSHLLPENSAASALTAESTRTFPQAKGPQCLSFPVGISKTEVRPFRAHRNEPHDPAVEVGRPEHPFLHSTHGRRSRLVVLAVGIFHPETRPIRREPGRATACRSGNNRHVPRWRCQSTRANLSQRSLSQLSPKIAGVGPRTEGRAGVDSKAGGAESGGCP